MSAVNKSRSTATNSKVANPEPTKAQLRTVVRWAIANGTPVNAGHQLKMPKLGGKALDSFTHFPLGQKGNDNQGTAYIINGDIWASQNAVTGKTLWLDYGPLPLRVT